MKTTTTAIALAIRRGTLGTLVERTVSDAESALRLPVLSGE
jgi:hypothetical protein